MCITVRCKPGSDAMNFEVKLYHFNQAVFPAGPKINDKS